MICVLAVDGAQWPGDSRKQAVQLSSSVGL